MAVQGSPIPPLARGGTIPIKMYYVYLLKSIKDKGFYIGYSSDLKKRIEEHLKGFVNSTKNRKPLELFYYEAYKTKDEALAREKKLKNFGSSYKGLLKRLNYKINR